MEKTNNNHPVAYSPLNAYICSAEKSAVSLQHRPTHCCYWGLSWEYLPVASLPCQTGLSCHTHTFSSNRAKFWESRLTNRNHSFGHRTIRNANCVFYYGYSRFCLAGGFLFCFFVFIAWQNKRVWAFLFGGLPWPCWRLRSLRNKTACLGPRFDVPTRNH